MSSSQLDGSREPDYVQPSIPGYNIWPYDSGKLHYTTAILDTGANSTYVTHRLLLDNTTLPSSASVTVADGTKHPITASGTLLGHPSIRADLVPSFHQNLVGVSPILNQGALGIITRNEMFLLDCHPYVAKLVNFAIKYSKHNNLIIMTGQKSHGLYKTSLNINPQAHLSIHSHHFTTLHDMVYYFYLVFNCPHVEAYCKLVSSHNIAGLPAELTPTNIRKFYPHMLTIGSLYSSNYIQT